MQLHRLVRRAKGFGFTHVQNFNIKIACPIKLRFLWRQVLFLSASTEAGTIQMTYMSLDVAGDTRDCVGTGVQPMNGV